MSETEVKTKESIKGNLDYILWLNNSRYDLKGWYVSNFSDGCLLSVRNWLMNSVDVDKFKFIACDDYEQYSFISHKLTASLIVQVLMNKDVSYLDSLLVAKSDEEKKTKFFSLLAWVMQMQGVYVLDRVATNSDFWNAISWADLSSTEFSSFHVFNFLHHKGKKVFMDCSNATKEFGYKIFNIYENSDIGNEEKVMASRQYAEVVINKTLEILDSDYFNELFVEFFGDMAKGFEKRSEIYYYISNAMPSDFREVNLINRKLESIGFYSE